MKTQKKKDLVGTQADYLYDIMIKHNMVEISVLDKDILSEAIKSSKSKNRSCSSYLHRLTNSVRGKQLFEYVGIFYFPYVCYKGCRVYKIKTIKEKEKLYYEK